MPADEEDGDGGCCDEDCCNRTCCGGRVACSLEAGFAAPFAVMAYGATVYANYSCLYVRVNGNKYNSGSGGEIWYDSFYTVAVVQRGIFIGEPSAHPSSAQNRICVDWISLQRFGGSSAVDIDAWWYASMACAVAATAFGFAALVQILALPCFRRSSQRCMARCASALSVLTALLEGCTLFYRKSNAVRDVDWGDYDVDFTNFTLYVSGWIAVGSLGCWLIVAFILCFLKGPITDDGDGSDKSGGERRASTRGLDDDDGGYGEGNEMEAIGEPDPPPEAAVIPAPVAAAGLAPKKLESSDEAEMFQDARTGTLSAQTVNSSAEHPFSSENGSLPPWEFPRQSANDFVDG